MDKGIVTFAKMIVGNGGANALGMHRQDFEGEIIRRAEKRQGESSQQAFTRFITTDETGKLLFKASLLAPVRQAAQDLAPRKSPEPEGGPATRELNEMARAMARDKGLSFEQSFSRIWSDPARAELVNRAKREQTEARREVRDQRWPMNDAERLSQTREWVDSLDAVGRRRFRPNAQ
jgi:hypothetical protein